MAINGSEIETYVIDDDDDSQDGVASILLPEVEMDEDENRFQTINSDLDKQIAQDMEAIRNYISKADPIDPMSKRIEFFNNMDNSYIDKCMDQAETNHILYQHTLLGTIKWHECSQCDFKVKDKGKLREHVIAKHTNLKEVNWFVCKFPNCDVICVSNEELQKHVSLVHEWKCKECDDSYFNESELLRHMGDRHGKEVFRCQHQQCKFVAATQEDLRKHIFEEHVKLNVSWYKCEKCAYRTARKANLDRHIMCKHSAIF